MSRKISFDVDASDLRLWASGGCAAQFIKEVTELSDVAKRMVLKNLDARDAGKYEAYEKVLSIFREYENMK